MASLTTANPTLYRAGLAFQTITPNWRRWKVTLVAGLVTTVAALFPALMMKLLDFVAIYGLLLMPMGAVVFADFWLLPRLGLQPLFAKERGLALSWPAAAAWLVTLAWSSRSRSRSTSRHSPVGSWPSRSSSWRA